MMGGVADLHLPGRVIFGRDAASVIGPELAERGVQRAFLLTPPSLAGHPYVARIVDALGSTLVGVDAQCSAHTPQDAVLDCAARARGLGAQALVAVGGGSVIDGAKIARLSMDEDLTRPEDLARWRTQPIESASTRTAVLAVPTTLSAAEFSGIAGLLDPSSNVKNVFHHPALIPDVVVLDPSATLTAPDWLVLSSGIRAVDHCVETVLSAAPNPFADASALHGFRLLVSNLPAVRRRPGDMRVRLDLQFAMWLSMVGPGIGVPLGASHAIGRAIGGVFGVPHGKTSCVMLAPVLAWNESVDAERQQQLQALFAQPSGSLSESVRALVEDVGEPSRLRDLGIGKAEINRLIEPSLAMLQVKSVSGNIRPVSSAQDVQTILEMAW